MPDNGSMNFLAKSVTADEMSKVIDRSVIRIIVPWSQYGYDQVALPPMPPPYWTPKRDAVLRSTIHHEAMWAGAVGIAITKMSCKAFTMTSDTPKRASNAQEVFLSADGKQVGWVGFISKQLRDFLTTDNGQFFEIVRETKAATSRVAGIKHLDSIRCQRTGDPKIPVLYQDKLGAIHELKDYQVVSMADMPDPGETYFGVGSCAASKAYSSIYKLASIEWYVGEKVSGKHPLAIHIVNGLLDSQIQGAVASAKAEETSRGVASYMGAVIIGIPSQVAPDLVTIPLAELPDRFNRKEEFDIAVLTYANSIGLDVQEMQPLTGQALGTGAQSNVLHEKQLGKGMAAWLQQFTHLVNEFVLDDSVTFAFTEKDYRDMQSNAAVSKARVDVAAARIQAGITNPQQELVLLIDQEELPSDFLPPSVSPGESISDTEKPKEETVPGALEATLNPTMDWQPGQPFGQNPMGGFGGQPGGDMGGQPAPDMGGQPTPDMGGQPGGDQPQQSAQQSAEPGQPEQPEKPPKKKLDRQALATRMASSIRSSLSKQSRKEFIPTITEDDLQAATDSVDKAVKTAERIVKRKKRHGNTNSNPG